VFDLDETLVHVNRGKAYNMSEYFVPVIKPDGTQVKVGFNIRPYCVEMLAELKPLYNIVLMTASVDVYAQKVIKVIDSKNEYFQLVISKDSCRQYPGGKTIKDLLIFEDLYDQEADEKGDALRNFRYEEIVLVDNFASAYAY
jgi:TFIIF-interacting CTD phosphatase-like protein